MATQQSREAALEAFAAWQQGDQQGALDRIKPFADEGDRIAVGLISWFLHQMGEPRWREGVPYALKAAGAGQPWVINYYLGNMLNDPTLRGQVPELMQAAVSSGWGIDPIAHAAGPLSQGDRATALRLLEVAAPSPDKEHWTELATSLQADVERVEQAARDAEDRRSQVLESLNSYESQVAAERDRISTEINQLATLIDQAANAQAQTLFKEEAEKNVKQAVKLWWGGFVVLILAAGLAVTPLLLHYFGKEAYALGGTALTTTHLAPSGYGPAFSEDQFSSSCLATVAELEEDPRVVSEPLVGRLNRALNGGQLVATPDSLNV